MADYLPVSILLERRLYFVIRLTTGGCAKGRIGSWCDRPLVDFVAGKRSVKFRFPEAAIHHRVLTTRKSRSASGGRYDGTPAYICHSNRTPVDGIGSGAVSGTGFHSSPGC